MSDGPANPDVDHGIPSRECDEGTCDCAGKPANAPFFGDKGWKIYRPDKVWIARDHNGEIMGYMVEND